MIGVEKYVEVITNGVKSVERQPASSGEAVVQTLNITPTTSAQTFNAPSGIDGYNPVNVSAVTSSIDANITAGNIKYGVSILGVTGTAEIAPEYYIEKTKDNNNRLSNGSYLINLSNFTDVLSYVLAYSYYGNSNIGNTVTFSSLSTLSGEHACVSMFYGCTYIVNANFPVLTTISGNNALEYCFGSCISLKNINLSSLTTISGSTSCYYMFSGCRNISTIDLSSLTTISGSMSCSYMFFECTSLTSVILSNLTEVSGNSSCSNMFRKCTSLTTLSFPLLTSFGSYTNQFYNMLQGVTGCTAHFRSDIQNTISSWSDVIAGFGGTNTTVLFDLPATE